MLMSCHEKKWLRGMWLERLAMVKIFSQGVGNKNVSLWAIGAKCCVIGLICPTGHKTLGVRLTQWAFKKGLWRGEFYHPLTIPKRGTSPKDTMTNSRNLFMPAVAGDIGCVMENYIIRKYLKIRPIKTVWSSWLILTLWLI